MKGKGYFSKYKKNIIISQDWKEIKIPKLFISESSQFLRKKSSLHIILVTKKDVKPIFSLFFLLLIFFVSEKCLPSAD